MIVLSINNVPKFMIKIHADLSYSPNLIRAITQSRKDIIDETTDDDSGYGMIHLACRIHSIEPMEKILKMGADIHTRSVTGDNTALHHAAFLGRADLINLLLEYNASPKARNKQNQTPYDISNPSLNSNSMRQLCDDGKSPLAEYDPYKKEDPTAEKAQYEEQLLQEHIYLMHYGYRPEIIEAVILPGCDADFSSMDDDTLL